MTQDKVRIGTSPFKNNGSRPITGPLPIPEPQSIAETGLNEGFIGDLILKMIYFGGQISGSDICERTKLPFNQIVERMLDFLKREELVGVVSTRGIGERIGLSDPDADLFTSYRGEQRFGPGREAGTRGDVAEERRTGQEQRALARENADVDRADRPRGLPERRQEAQRCDAIQ